MNVCAKLSTLKTETHRNMATISTRLSALSLLLMTSTIVGCAAHSGHQQISKADIKVERLDVKLGEPRQIFTVTPIDASKIIIVGGLLEKDPNGASSRSGEVLDLSDRTATRMRSPKNQMTHQRWGHRATRLNDNNIFICGGTPQTTCEKYVVKTQSFVTAGTLSHARSGNAQLTLPSGNVLITGGYNKGDSSLGKVLSSAEVFSLKSNRMSLTGAMHNARAGHSMFLYAGKVYIVGGLTPESAVIEQYDETTGRFTETSMRLPYGLKDFQPYQVGSKVFLIGGTKPDGNSIDRVVKIDFATQQVEEMPGTLLEPREDVAVCANPIKNQILTFGGETKGHGRNGNHSGKVELISLGTLAEPFAITPTDLEIYRDDAQTVSLEDGKCLVFGGTNNAGDVDSTVLRIEF